MKLLALISSLLLVGCVRVDEPTPPHDQTSASAFYYEVTLMNGDVICHDNVSESGSFLRCSKRGSFITAYYPSHAIKEVQRVATTD